MTHSPLLFNQSTQYSTLKLLNFMVALTGIEPVRSIVMINRFSYYYSFHYQFLVCSLDFVFSIYFYLGSYR